MSKTAYFRTHADMYVFAKGKPKTANLLNDKPNIWANQQVIRRGPGRNGDKPFRLGQIEYLRIPEHSRRGSVWRYEGIGNRDNLPGDLPYGELNAPSRPVSSTACP